jgi:hypothetical protein
MRPVAQTLEGERLEVVAISAIVIALIAGYFAFSYKQHVDDWEAAAGVHCRDPSGM